MTRIPAPANIQSVKQCRQYCRADGNGALIAFNTINFRYAGVSVSNGAMQCRCGNTYGKYGPAEPDECKACESEPVLKCGAASSDGDASYTSLYATGPLVACGSAAPGQNSVLACPIGTRVETVLMASYGANTKPGTAPPPPSEALFDESQMGRRAVCKTIKKTAYCGGSTMVQCPQGMTMVSGGTDGDGMTSSFPVSEPSGDGNEQEGKWQCAFDENKCNRSGHPTCYARCCSFKQPKLNPESQRRRKNADATDQMSFNDADVQCTVRISSSKLVTDLKTGYSSQEAHASCGKGGTLVGGGISIVGLTGAPYAISSEASRVQPDTWDCSASPAGMTLVGEGDCVAEMNPLYRVLEVNSGSMCNNECNADKRCVANSFLNGTLCRLFMGDAMHVKNTKTHTVNGTTVMVNGTCTKKQPITCYARCCGLARRPKGALQLNNNAELCMAPKINQCITVAGGNGSAEGGSKCFFGVDVGEGAANSNMPDTRCVTTASPDGSSSSDSDGGQGWCFTKADKSQWGWCAAACQLGLHAGTELTMGSCKLTESLNAKAWQRVTHSRCSSRGSEIAQGKPATANRAQETAARAVDGDTNGDGAGSCYNSGAQEEYGWWKVDLEEKKRIHSVKVWNRADCCGERLADFQVRVGEANATWDQSHTCSNNAGFGTGKRLSAVEGDRVATAVCGMEGEVVHVVSNIKGKLTICEVQVPPSLSFSLMEPSS